MWTSTLPDDPIVASWWVEAETAREWETCRRAAEQDKRMRQLRRRVEKIDESIVLALSASDARRHLRRQGIYERSDRLGPIEHSRHVGQILRVW
jgi:hypothetical protein